MRIAFDVMGTLEGPKRVRDLFDWFQSKGCQMVIWSTFESVARDCARDMKVGPEVVVRQKFSERTTDGQTFVDICVDDQDYSSEDGVYTPFLSSKMVIPVHTIPNKDKFEETYGHLLTAS